MAFSAKDVQALREMTGAGMMDCKNALVESDGNIDKAIEFLREKGLAAAAKKAGRIAADGMVFSNVCDNGVGVIVEVNSETDFVAKNDEFQKFVRDVADVIVSQQPADVDALLNCKYVSGDITVAQALQEKVLTIGENIKIRRFNIYTSDRSVAYIHMGGKIGVLTNIKVEGVGDLVAVDAMGRDVCMQIAAMRPQWLSSDQVPAEELEKEKGILQAQIMNDEKQKDKPANVIEKMVEGRIRKFYEDNCLLNQAFVKENKITVAQYVEQEAKRLGGKIELVGFTRFEKGEGVEKREDDLAAEVARLTGGN